MIEKNRRSTISRGLFIKALSVGALVLIVVAGCDFFGVSIRDRIDQFMGDVNAGRFSDLKEHLNSGADNYGNADAAFWATYFDEAETYTLNDLTITGSTATGVMESSDPSWDTLSVTFSMREETSGVWKILSITRGNDTIFD